MSTVTVVSYIKHFDNETKGTMEYGTAILANAILLATNALIRDALDAGVDADADPANLFTITKAELAEATNYIGAPKAAF